MIFAYHGGDGISTWFYSMIVVVSGLAFVVFGPLLLCRFLIYAYYRQMDVQAQNLAGIYARVTKNAVSCVVLFVLKLIFF